MSTPWTAVLAAVLVCLLIILIKFLIWNCLIAKRDDDSRPILRGRDRRENFWIEYERLRLQGLRVRQPPPDFDEALRTSRPVSYIDIEEPPPTYEDFLKSHSSSPSPSPESNCPCASSPSSSSSSPPSTSTALDLELQSVDAKSIGSVSGCGSMMNRNSISADSECESAVSVIGALEFDDNFVDIDLSAVHPPPESGLTISIADLQAGRNFD